MKTFIAYAPTKYHLDTTTGDLCVASNDGGWNYLLCMAHARNIFGRDFELDKKYLVTLSTQPMQGSKFYYALRNFWGEILYQTRDGKEKGSLYEPIESALESMFKGKSRVRVFVKIEELPA